MWRAVLVGTAALVAAAGCERSAAPVVHRSPRPSLVRCDPGFSPGDGFIPAEGQDVEAPDHVGVRESYRDPRGRMLHFTAGIDGDFGEGSPVGGSFQTATGERARLFGVGTNWVLVWSRPPPCQTWTAAGNGFTREEFLDRLVAAGVIPAE